MESGVVTWAALSTEIMLFPVLYRYNFDISTTKPRRIFELNRNTNNCHISKPQALTLAASPASCASLGVFDSCRSFLVRAMKMRKAASGQGINMRKPLRRRDVSQLHFPRPRAQLRQKTSL